jgi:hypothetical protein
MEPTAKLLETFLRVVSPVMMERYGREYLQLLKSIQRKVVPKLSIDGAMFPVKEFKVLLEDYLTEVLSSDGRSLLNNR